MGLLRIKTNIADSSRSVFKDLLWATSKSDPVDKDIAVDYLALGISMEVNKGKRECKVNEQHSNEKGMEDHTIHPE